MQIVTQPFQKASAGIALAVDGPPDAAAKRRSAAAAPGERKMTRSNPEGGDMRKPLTEMQRAFIDWCIAYSKFEIVDSMSISMVSAVANSYDFVADEAKLDRYGYCTPRMIRWGKSLFPDPPGSPEGSGFDDAYEDVCTALD
ncbi:hypothetical protein, partial [Burkholderia gladioli]|uniref:hypothetical protein n=1 Tax=Burkholderia gladioli TaxID=28095 RepID=UPI00163EBC02